MTDGAEDGERGTDERAVDPVDPDPNALPAESLRYPEFTFPVAGIEPNGSVDLQRDLTAEEMGAWLDDLAGGLASHDIAVESTDGYVTFGVAPAGVAVRFDPDENHRGELEVTFRLNARAMFVSDDPTGRKSGARGRSGFVPIEMLTTDRDRFQCYNWIDDPTDP